MVKTKVSANERLNRKLAKAGIRANPNPLKRVSGEAFYKAMAIAKKGNPEKKWMVDLHTKKEYQSMKCFMFDGGKGGYAIKDGNEIVSVFSTEKGSRSLQKIIPHAVMMGGRKLDFFGNGLENQYRKFGAVVTGRLPFDPNEAPDDYKPSYKTPDYLGAAYLPSSVDEVIKQYKERPEELDWDTVKHYDDWEKWIEGRDSAMKSAHSNNSQMAMVTG